MLPAVIACQILKIAHGHSSAHVLSIALSLSAAHQSFPHCPRFASHIRQRHQSCLLIVADIELVYFLEKSTFFFHFSPVYTMQKPK